MRDFTIVFRDGAERPVSAEFADEALNGIDTSKVAEVRENGIEEAEGEYHFFASSVTGWESGTDLNAVVKRLKRADDRNAPSWYRPTGCNVYRVPLPAKAHYKIRDYVPVVEGVRFLKFVYYHFAK